jgi:hypothetical protein
MDEDGSAESGRTRLARGTKPHALLGEPERTDGASVDATVPAAIAPRGGEDARVRSALLTAPARAGSLPASPGPARRAVRASEAPEPGRADPAPTDAGMTAGEPVSAGGERIEMAGGAPDRSIGDARSNTPRGSGRIEMPGGVPDRSIGDARSNTPRGSERIEMPGGIDARGSGPVPVGGAPGRAPAQSICEAVEQLIEAQEADEAIAEWMQGGG